ncbi:GH36-type glycosyl hydrolase domain-containing protein [Pseudoduganella albidiflava]|uniref:Glycosyl transferase n=1 Tax=Pseudoduganella albidiflava TaxID=321983 RepID=A0A411X285_9BURK|nr:glycosyl transferase [Pseudoduganella albidiflava]QBI03079.1 glycosyl transferase [Pseudoduganella albidiflava]GGY58857.1 glycosyl transferase [Pseudoduganella albidiflava]
MAITAPAGSLTGTHLDAAHLPPNARLLSNGRLTTLITESGSGFTRAGDIALTRWNGDRVTDAEGWFFYLRDAETHDLWSLGAQPCAAAHDPDLQRAAGAGLASMWLEVSAHGILAHMEVVVHPDKDVELRSIVVTNLSGRSRLIELTGYLEVVLARQADEAAHPAFSKLFVQTEHDAATGALLAHRRPRGANEPGLWMVNAALGGSEPQFDTDRASFLGRGRGPWHPQGVDGTTLAGTAGNVLDPAMALRRTLALGIGEQARLVFMLGTAPTRAEALALAAALPDMNVPAILGDAQLRETVLLGQVGLPGTQAEYYHQLAAAVLYGQSAARAGAAGGASAEAPADAGQYGLPRGELAIVHTAGPDDLMLQALLSARRLWQAKGLNLNMLVLDEHGNGTAIEQGLLVRRTADFAAGHLAQFERTAHLVVRGKLPGLSRPDGHAAMPPRRRVPTLPADAAPPRPREALQCFNGYGGFNAAGDEYVIRMDWDRHAHGLRRPPLAWSNAISNETFGCLVSDGGAGYTWSRNSRVHRLTPWHNDPVADPHGEALYVRDEDTGEFWSPLPGPVPAAEAYEAAHGFGYSRFDHASHGLRQETTIFVPRHDPVKIVRVAVSNEGDRPRRVALYSFQHLVLGGTPADSSRHVVTGHEPGADATVQAIVATNAHAGVFADGVTVAAVLAPGAQVTHFTADRAAFLGRHGAANRPAGLAVPALDHATGAGLDPCAAFQAVYDLAPGQTVSCVFLLGETLSRETALELVRRYQAEGAVPAALEEVTGFWRDTVGAVRVETPVKELDLVMNGWLMYQNLSCRIWGRSAFYQSGGAFGFRDQLQDSSALVYARPDLARSQILLHAAHQFEEGDVLHWWHPAPMEQGLRTRFSDDLCWLPYITAFYVKTTGDLAVLDEVAPFLTARQLEEGEDEEYLTPAPAGTAADVYEHCCRALDRSLTKGAHGLPLMGTGDWNDGMNRVGREGRGESVWMGFFLMRILRDFIPFCEKRRDGSRVKMYTDYLDHLARALNDGGWDGEWYRRAYYDNGAVLGSKDSDECRIDALAQAWAVISEAAPPERARQALDAMEARLVAEEDQLIRLLAPPFVDTPHDPGYIKGYVAGVRENGGQYTHAACWAVRALAEAGRRDRAARLLRMLSPVSHALDQAAADRYKVEPYVVAADIYGAAPHVGRGGWTWYTGSAGWLFRVGLESVLGCTFEDGDTLVVAPRIPDDWPEFHVHYRLPDGDAYHVAVRNPNGSAAKVIGVTLDGVPLNLADGAARIPLMRDGGSHAVEIVLGSA